MNLQGIPAPTIDWNSTNITEEWRKFTEHCTLIFKGPLKDQGDDVHVTMLLLYMGAKGRDVFRATNMSDEDRKNPDIIVTKIRDHLAPKINPVFARFQFYNITQGDRTMEQFITVLRTCVIVLLGIIMVINAMPGGYRRGHTSAIGSSSCLSKDYYACLPVPHRRNRIRCIPMAQLCNGQCDCPLSDDERFCHFINPTVTKTETTTLTTTRKSISTTTTKSISTTTVSTVLESSITTTIISTVPTISTVTETVTETVRDTGNGRLPLSE